MTASDWPLTAATPVRTRLLPYGRQTIDDDDVAAVTEMLRSDWLTTGPKVAEFERALAAVAGTSDAVAVSTGHSRPARRHVCPGHRTGRRGDRPRDDLRRHGQRRRVPRRHAGLRRRRCPTTCSSIPRQVEARITPRTKAVVAVDYAGQPCDYDALEAVADEARPGPGGRRLPCHRRQLSRPAGRLAGRC